MVPDALRPFPADDAGLVEQLASCTNGFMAAATCQLLGDVDALADEAAATLEQQLTAALEGEGVFWSSVLAQEIAALVRDSGLPTSAAAAIVADVIDHEQGTRFDRVLTGTGVWTLDPGDPYPVAASPLGRQDLSASHPAAQPRTPGDLANLRFASPVAADFEVAFHCHEAEVLVVPPFGGVVATGHPNLDLAECGPPGDVVPDGFFGFPGRDPSHEGWVRGVVAAAAGAQVIVLPELSVDEDLAAELVDEWKAEPLHTRASVFVPGSCHTVADGRRVNRTSVYLRGLGLLLVADKQEPFTSGGRTEAIDDVDPRVDVHVVGGWRIATCICRDGLRPQLPELLGQLGVSLLVIPAMSPDASGFELLNSIVIRNAGVYVVANNPATWPADERHPIRHPAQCVMGLPLTHPAGPTVNLGAGGSAIRGAWHVALDDAGTSAYAT